MEHLNIDLKEGICHLSSNVNEAPIICIGKCLGKLIDFKANYDKSTGVTPSTGYHTPPSQAKDLESLIEELNKAKVFSLTEGRKHQKISTFKGNTISTVDKEVLVNWLKKQLGKLTGQ